MEDLVLDGNAIGGLLSEIFALDVTGAGSRCEACGALEPVGATHAYMAVPGVVLRCSHCDAVLIRIARTTGRTWLDLRGVSYLELHGEPA